MSKLEKVLVMAGGTGGHIFPGLAVAKALREQGKEVHWLGTPTGLEARLVTEAGFPIHYISIGGLRGKGLKTLFFMPFRLVFAITQSLRIIHRLQPDVVLGMGGFVSGPGGIAAWLLRRSLVIHEQNAKVGLTNKWLAYLAAKVLEGFPDTFSASKRVVTTGNPVRHEIANLPAPTERLQGRARPLRLLVVGGSLGAAAINGLVPRVLARLPEIEVLHQSGEKYYEDTVKAYAEAGVKATIKPFIAEMDQAYAWADMVLCRAGASTIAELCAAGLGAILVPYPYAVDDHQTANANYLVKHHGAIVIQQVALTEDKLVSVLQQLSASPEACMTMAKAAYQLRRVNAANQVIDICKEICH